MDSGAWRGRARGKGAASGHRCVVPRRWLPRAGTSPARQRTWKARAAGKEAIGPRVAEEQGRWRRACLGTVCGPMQNFRPWPGPSASDPKPSPCPKCPPEPGPPGGHLGAGSAFPDPAPSLLPGPGALSWTASPPPVVSPLPLPAPRPMLERSWLLAQRLPPGHLPSDGRLNPLRRFQETFIPVSLPLHSPPSPPLLSLSFLNPGVLWAER